MPFIGNQPALSYTSFAKQDFTTSATTSYTLDNPVTNANELALFINFVRQEPTTAYSASGTSLTLTSATSASDDMYCVYLGKAVQTVNPPNASVGASQIVDSSIALGKLSATGTKDATTFLRGDNTFAVAGGTNTPAFLAYRSTSNQSISNQTETQCQFQTELFDTDSCYDTSTYRFTPTIAGKYFLFAMLQMTGTINAGAYFGSIRKNGASASLAEVYNSTTTFMSYSLAPHCIVEANGSSDYFDCTIYYAGTASLRLGIQFSQFGGYKIIE